MPDDAVRWRDISSLEGKVNKLDNKLNDVQEKLGEADAKINRIGSEVMAINKKFEELMRDRERAEALSQATTELVRIRQEIEDKFGNYKLVRDTMLGVLQATDLALVKKTTMSNISEELMITTPKYWLAPLVIAVTAWISNDRDLADRAIKEALKRDEERTALAMALICRRNGRQVACYEWLSIYFSKLNVGNFTEGGYTFVDAYINKVFGEDENHICSDYMANWLAELKKDDVNFEENQIETWKGICINKTCSIGEKYPNLKSNVIEFDKIDSYASRVESSDGLMKFFETINNTPVDIEKMKAMVDANLIKLISEYDVDEVELRNEEYCFQKVKDSNGNIRFARVKKELLERQKREREKKINLVEQMTGSVVSDDNMIPSKKKTAIAILRPYINKAYDRYIDENKGQFPKDITISVNGHNAKYNQGTDLDRLEIDYKEHLKNKKQEEITAMKNKSVSSKKKSMIVAISAVIISLLLFAKLGVLGVIGLAVAGFFFYKYGTADKKLAEVIKDLDNKYITMEQEGLKTMQSCIDEWSRVNTNIGDFDSNRRELIV